MVLFSQYRYVETDTIHITILTCYCITDNIPICPIRYDTDTDICMQLFKRYRYIKTDTNTIPISTYDYFCDTDMFKPIPIRYRWSIVGYISYRLAILSIMIKSLSHLPTYSIQMGKCAINVLYHMIPYNSTSLNSHDPHPIRLPKEIQWGNF
jgi:hypothetical protein